MTPHTIWYVRHGETTWNSERRLQGSLDSPLTERGRAHAAANAQTLMEAVPDIGILPFVVSPLGRARETVAIIRSTLGLSSGGYRVEPRLAEVRFGDWEGRTWPEIESIFPDHWSEREREKWTFTPPNGESFAYVSQRLKDWLRELTSDVVVVGHGAVGRILRGLNLSLPEALIPDFPNPDHDRVYRLANGTEAVL